MTSLALREFDRDRFLRDHWQQTPLLLRNVFHGWRNPLAPDELAGLACEPDVESRLIIYSAPHSWELEQGPLSPGRFAGLGTQPWTLLVQAVDHHVPEVAALLEPFRFIPNWRIDDVMVSYAADGGGVGPHFDQYDVFLVQGLGRRRWRVGPRCDNTTRLFPHDGLRLLAEFEPTHEWILEPGDILYLPPGFAHDGVAVGDDCMTYSVGFRAPARAELVSGWADHLLDTLTSDDRYGDIGLAPQENPGEITRKALARLNRMVTEGLADEDGFARWFGQFVTAPKSEPLDWAPEEYSSIGAVRAALVEGASLERNAASRFAFVRLDAGTIILFVDGGSYECRGPLAAFAEQLCSRSTLAVDPAWISVPGLAELVCELVNGGSVALIERH